jgi:hypothetical protein
VHHEAMRHMGGFDFPRGVCGWVGQCSVIYLLICWAVVDYFRWRWGGGSLLHRHVYLFSGGGEVRGLDPYTLPFRDKKRTSGRNSMGRGRVHENEGAPFLFAGVRAGGHRAYFLKGAILQLNQVHTVHSLCTLFTSVIRMCYLSYAFTSHHTVLACTPYLR